VLHPEWVIGLQVQQLFVAAACHLLQAVLLLVLAELLKGFGRCLDSASMHRCAGQ
jgi:hypothetical protein